MRSVFKLKTLLLTLLTSAPLATAQLSSSIPSQALFPGLRLTYHTPQPASKVLSALYAEIGPAPNPTTAFARVIGNITAFDQANKERFIAGAKSVLGKNVEFTIIGQITYDSWFPLFGINKGLILRRIILGNPLKLINGVAPYDIPAVMFLPLEIVIRELPATASGSGGTDIIYNKPSSMVTVLEAGPVNYARVLKATLELDRMMAELTALIAK